MARVRGQLACPGFPCCTDLMDGGKILRFKEKCSKTEGMLSFAQKSNKTRANLRLSYYFLSISPQAPASELQRRIGFRTVELVREPLVGSGRNISAESFYFRINGLTIVAK